MSMSPHSKSFKKAERTLISPQTQVFNCDKHKVLLTQLLLLCFWALDQNYPARRHANEDILSSLNYALRPQM